LITLYLIVETWGEHAAGDCVEDAVEVGRNEVWVVDWLEVPKVVLRKHSQALLTRATPDEQAFK